jgi:hypothetical protein
VTAGTTAVLAVSREGRPWYEVLGFSFLLSLIFSIWFSIAIGRNLGLFFGGLLLASILAPLLVVVEKELKSRILIVTGIVGAMTIVWLSCVFNDAITLGEWSGAVMVLLVFALAAAALAALFARVRIPPAAVVVVAIAWLSWPIWLAPALRGGQSSERIVGVVVAVNPTFAMQGALAKSFNVPWAQYRIAYRLTNIGDDIPYQMPTSKLGCGFFHGVIAFIGMLAAHWPRRTRAGQEHPPADQSPRST